MRGIPVWKVKMMPPRETSSYVIRPARADDLAAVKALLLRSDLPLDGLEEQFGENYAVAECGGEIIGVEGIERHGSDGLLRSAAIAPEWRGRGVGQALTRERIEWARGSQLAALYLLTTTAGKYFPKFGFAPAARETAPEGIRRSREFAEACPASAAFMRLTLHQRNHS